MIKQRRQAYRAIEEVSQGHHGAVTKLLDVIGVSRQAYYKGLRREETLWEVHDQTSSSRHARAWHSMSDPPKTA